MEHVSLDSDIIDLFHEQTSPPVFFHMLIGAPHIF
jgi:hypothetical protein